MVPDGCCGKAGEALALPYTVLVLGSNPGGAMFEPSRIAGLFFAHAPGIVGVGAVSPRTTTGNPNTLPVVALGSEPIAASSALCFSSRDTWL